jgi:hypothetical protein
MGSSGLTSGGIRDYEDRYGEFIAFERSDMAINDTKKVASKFVDESGNLIWIEEEIGRNSAGETIYIKLLSKGADTPSWIPAGIL